MKQNLIGYKNKSRLHVSRGLKNFVIPESRTTFLIDEI